MVSDTQLEEIIMKFPKAEQRIRSHRRRIGEHILIQCNRYFRPDSAVYQYMSQFAVWDKGLDLKLFEALHHNAWASYTDTHEGENAMTIFECAFLQDHITELMLFYRSTSEEMLEYFLG